MRQGLSNDTLQNILEKNGRLWISTNKGLDIIDSSRSILEHIGKAEGLTSEIGGMVFIDNSKRLWVGSSGQADGIDIFDFDKETVQHLGFEQGMKEGQFRI